MHRLLININTTRTVGQINIVISPRYLTRIYEQDLISMRGHIVIFDKEGFFIPSMNAEINNLALKGEVVYLIMPFFIADEEEKGHANNVECSCI